MKIVAFREESDGRVFNLDLWSATTAPLYIEACKSDMIIIINVWIYLDCLSNKIWLIVKKYSQKVITSSVFKFS